MKSIFVFLKKRLVDCSVDGMRYIGVFWCLLVGFPIFYCADVDLFLTPHELSVIYLVCFVVVQVIFEQNHMLRDSVYGPTAVTILMVELPFFFFYVQYRFWVAVALLVLIVASSCAIHHISITAVPACSRSDRRRLFALDKATSFGLRAAAALLLIPAIVGYFKETKTPDLSDTDWIRFVQDFEEQEVPQRELTLFERHADTVAELNEWDRLNNERRLDLLRRIGLIEMEYLGVNGVDVQIDSEKMPMSYFAYYDDSIKQIRINIVHICSDDVEENVNTILHEVFHVYQHSVVDSLDFNSEQVQNSFYYSQARIWNENFKNYVTGANDYNAYATQPVEADANRHADARTAEYLAATGMLRADG